MTSASGNGDTLSVLMLLSHKRARVAGRIAGAAFCLFLLLGLGIASCSPGLHNLICPDAGKADDFCVIKQFQSGMVEPPLAEAVVAPLRFVLVVTPRQGEEQHLAFPLFRLSPSRAPPFLLG